MRPIATNNPNCVGENVSPELHWSNVPDGTKSLVLLMFDPEGRAPSGVSHWVAYGIDPSKVTGFAEGETSKLPTSMSAARARRVSDIIPVPCTPPGQRRASLYIHPHRYGFCSRRVARLA